MPRMLNHRSSIPHPLWLYVLIVVTGSGLTSPGFAQDEDQKNKPAENIKDAPRVKQTPEEKAEALRDEIVKMKKSIDDRIAKLKMDEATAVEKTAELADDLKKEFLENHTAIGKLKSAIDSDPAGILAERLTGLNRRQWVLKLYWDELNSRHGDLRPRSRQNFDINLMRDIAQLIQKVRNDAKLRREVADLQRQLLGVNRINRNGNQANPFSQPIGPGADSLFNERIENEGSPPPNYPGFESGPFDSMRTDLSRMAQLKWSGSSLALDRDHWDSSFAGKSAQSVQEEVDRLLEAKGVPQRQDPQAEHLRIRQRTLANSPNVFGIFNKLAERLQNVGRGNGSFSAGGNNVSRSFGTPNLDGRLRVTDTQFEIQFLENVGLARILRLQANTDGRMNIVYIGNGVFSLTQQKDGQVTLGIQNDQDNVYWKADSFAELYADHPQKIESIVLPLFRHLGIGSPIARFDSETIQRVVSRLHGVGPDAQEYAQQLIADLDHDAFTRREGASKELKKNYAAYETVIKRALGERSTLSVEAQTRLASIVDTQEKQYVEADGLIDGMKLIDRPEYLVAILGKVKDSERTFIAARLTELSGQELGTDESAWKQWLDSKNP